MGFERFVPRATKQPLGVLEPPEIQIQRTKPGQTPSKCIGYPLKHKDAKYLNVLQPPLVGLKPPESAEIQQNPQLILPRLLHL